MSEHKLPSDQEVESLVRAHLARQEQTVDAQQVLAGVRARRGAAPRRSRLSARLRSRGEEGLFTADVMHNAIQIVKPHWNDRYCLWPDKALESRAAVLARAAERGRVRELEDLRGDRGIAVDDRRDVLELPAFRKLRPVLDDSIAVLAAPQDRCHGSRAGYEA